MSGRTEKKQEILGQDSK